MEDENSKIQMINTICYFLKIQKEMNFKNIPSDNVSLVTTLFSVLCKNRKFANVFIDAYLGNIDMRKEVIVVKKEFFFDAQNDLKSARILYEHGIYNHAVYHLQQGIEKLSKFWLLEFTSISHKKVREISHETPTGYIKFVEKELNKMNNVLKRSLKNSHTNSEYINLKKEVDKGIKKIADIRKKIFIKRNKKYVVSSRVKIELSKASYTEIINTLHELENIMNTIKIAFDKFINYQNIENLLKSLESSKYDLQIKDQEELNNLLSMFKIYIISHISGLLLYMLGAYTFPHESYARYYSEKNALKPSLYTTKLGIVRATPEILDTLDQIIKLYFVYEDIKNEKEAPEDGGMGRV